MLDETLKSQLAAYLAHLTRPIRITAWLDGTPASGEVRALLDELAGASPRVTWGEGAGEGERRPSFGVHLPGEAPRVRFAGVPLGHELTSLVLALLHVGGHPPRESAETLAAIRGLEGELRFETFFSQSCQSCPEVVQALSTLAALSPSVTHVAVEGARFREEAEARGVMAVPTVFLNGEPFATGRTGPRGDPLAHRPHGRLAQGRAPRAARRLRRARRGRRAGGRRGRDLRRAKGHRDRRGGRALRRAGARHRRHRELRLRVGHRGPGSSPPPSRPTWPTTRWT
ncbi:MAG: thioredoxin family protein [Sandaracinaceae bacterium]|nr:thioredoxin family protein [Sandaracinaceae bacterium]